LRSCLEAARWAASSFNEQPWRFLLARRSDADEFQRMLGCLMEANQAWASNAGALLLTVVSNSFTRNGKPNRAAEHDLGLAMGNLSVQATELGLGVHQMAGVDLDKIRSTYEIPVDFAPFSAIAIGHIANEGPLAERDQAPRSRKPLSEIAFAADWGKPAFDDE